MGKYTFIYLKDTERFSLFNLFFNLIPKQGFFHTNYPFFFIISFLFTHNSFISVMHVTSVGSNYAYLEINNENNPSKIHIIYTTNLSSNEPNTPEKKAPHAPFTSLTTPDRPHIKGTNNSPFLGLQINKTHAHLGIIQRTRSNTTAFDEIDPERSFSLFFRRVRTVFGNAPRSISPFARSYVN